MLRRFFKNLDQRLNLGYLSYRLWREPGEIRSFLRQRKGLQFEANLAGLSEDSKTARAKFSIVVPCYGISLLYVVELIASLEAQTFRNWQLCIADDGDPNGEVWSYFVDLQKTWGDRLRLIRHPQNRGICAATRSALQLADGEFVVFVDADDLLHPEALRLLALRIAEFSDCDFLYSDHDFMTDWGWRIMPLRKPDWSPELLIGVNYINHLTCVRRSLLLQNDDFFSDHLNGGQDTDFVLKMISRARRVVHVPFVLYHWRTRPGSVAASVDAKPWAFAAGARARAEYVEALKLGLQLPPRQSLQFQTGLAPNIRQIVLNERSCLGSEWLSEFKEKLKGATAGEIFQFRVLEWGDLNGDVLTLAAYAKLAGVACSLPFFDGKLRLAFTSSRQTKGQMARVLRARGHFSHFTGNVQCGALHGLTICKENFDAIVTDLESTADFRAVESSTAELGAAIGLSALKLGLRNVAVSAVCQTLEGQKQCPDQVRVVTSLWPPYDNLI